MKDEELHGREIDGEPEPPERGDREQTARQA